MLVAFFLLLLLLGNAVEERLRPPSPRQRLDGLGRVHEGLQKRLYNEEDGLSL